VLSHPLSFLIGTYGVRSVAPALLTPSIVICGLLVGKRLVPGWTAICSVVLLWCTWARGDFSSSIWPALAFWIGMYAVTGWLVLLFASYLEELLAAVIASGKAQTAAILAERARMARDLHDSLAQGFTGVITQLNAAEQAGVSRPDQMSGHIDKARAVAKEGLAQARASVMALRRDEDVDLLAALRNLCASSLAESGVSFSVEGSGLFDDIGREVRRELLAIVGEALTNVVRHAAAAWVVLTLSRDNGLVRLVVQDDGIGFDASFVAEGFGFRGMRERTAEIGGSLVVWSEPGSGTRIECEARIS